MQIAVEDVTFLCGGEASAELSATGRLPREGGPCAAERSESSLAYSIVDEGSIDRDVVRSADAGVRHLACGRTS